MDTVTKSDKRTCVVRRTDFNCGGDSSAKNQVDDKNFGERFVDVGVGDGVAFLATVSLSAGRQRHTRRDDSVVADFVSLRRRRRDAVGLYVRADKHFARPVHCPPDSSFVRLSVAVHGDGLGGAFSTTKNFRNDFCLYGKVRVSFYFGRDFFLVICAGRNFADNLFADDERRVTCARSVNLLCDFKILARRTNSIRNEPALKSREQLLRRNRQVVQTLSPRSSVKIFSGE